MQNVNVSVLEIIKNACQQRLVLTTTCLSLAHARRRPLTSATLNRNIINCNVTQPAVRGCHTLEVYLNKHTE